MDDAPWERILQQAGFIRVKGKNNFARLSDNLMYLVSRQGDRYDARWWYSMYPLFVPRISLSRGYPPACGRFPRQERTIRLDQMSPSDGETRLAEELANVLPVFDGYPNLEAVVDELETNPSFASQYARFFALVGLERIDEARDVVRDLLDERNKGPIPELERSQLNDFNNLADAKLLEAIRVSRDDNIRNLRLRKLIPKGKQSCKKAAKKRSAMRDLAIPMNYQEFKTHYIKILDGLMAERGFERGRGTTPTYWQCPHEDQRLTWVVCFNFSARGNSIFNVLLGPHWRGHDLESGDPFPRGVGYRQSLNPDGVGNSYTWNATDAEFREAVDALDRHGVPFFRHVDTPEKLLREEPSGILACDLGQYDHALPLIRKSLEALYEREYTKNDESRAGVRMHDETLARVECCLSLTSKQLGVNENEIRDNCRLKAAQAVKEEFANIVAANPRARWARKTLQEAEANIAGLT